MQVIIPTYIRIRKLKGDLSVEQSVNRLLKKGISPQKIVIGAAFYCRYWIGFPAGVIDPVGIATTSFANQTVDYNQLKELLAKYPENIFWDEKASAPYYFDGQQFISYDDVRSMAAKTDYVKARQLRGIMYWEHSLDLTGELLNAAVKQL